MFKERIMYVIQATLTSGSSATTIAGQAFAASTTHTIYLPADRCTWRIAETTGGGYSISNVAYFDGNAAAGQDLSTSNTNISASILRFGYIGKTGRFVEITN